MNYKFIITFSVFLNLFFIAICFYFTLGRPFLNLDYFLLLGLLCLPRNILTFTVLFIGYFIIFTVDILLIVIQIFPFIRLSDILYLGSFIFNGPILYRVLVLVLVLIFFLQFFIIRDYFFKKIQLSKKQIFSILLMLVLFVFVKNMLFPVKLEKIESRFNKKILDSQFLFFIKNKDLSFVQAINYQSFLEDSRYEASTLPLIHQLKQPENLSRKILIIVNESWGATSNAAHQQAILKPIYSKKNKLDWIKQGDFNFIGATVAGELRELCHKQPMVLDLKNVNVEEFRNCIPNQLKTLGYQTYAIHGAKSMMYERDNWYPKAGFEYLYFFDQLPKADICYAFEGRCDTGIPLYIRNLFSDNKKILVYWMTLNTHAPYDDKIFYGGLNCIALELKQNTETCKNYQLQYQFFTALARLIDDPTMNGVEVYVAGDHSPPIFNMSDNLFNFKGSNVAWLHFKIK